MEERRSHVWSPIEDLPPNWRETLVNSHVAALVRTWHDQSGELREGELYKQFLLKLKRQWAIETGIIEGLYTLSEASTKTLIEHGFDAALIPHEGPSDSTYDTLAKIKDQFDAIEGLYQFVSGTRPLGTSYIKELHRVITANQATYEGLDTLGNRVVRDLPKGEWKKMPNNLTGPDSFRFEFCPPEQVDSEMERLLDLHKQHEEQGVPPDLEAAWLHHRFVLIHPFTDGNGRVARCLATLVLLKANWFPLVVTRDDRVDYISALRQADQGTIQRLVEFVEKLQEREINRAISLGESQSPSPALRADLIAV